MLNVEPRPHGRAASKSELRPDPRLKTKIKDTPAPDGLQSAGNDRDEDEDLRL